MDGPPERAAHLIEAWYRAALAAVEPAAAVRRHLTCDRHDMVVSGRRVPMRGRLVVVAVGKAAVTMARGAEAVCGGLIGDGLAITKDGHAAGAALARVGVREAAHPIPDERGARATRKALALVEPLGAEDVVVALISGGGSALLEAPRPPVTLDDVAATTDLLLRAGAPIEDLNAVRVPLSLVKGGGLRRAVAPAALVTMILSDVLGNDPRIIASGPTVAGEVNPARGLAVLDRFGVREQVSARVVEVLAAPSDDDGRDRERAPVLEIVEVVGDNGVAVAAAAAAARAGGFRADVAWVERRGEAADLGREWVATCRNAPLGVDVLLGGGEATVTVRGDGVGGRNTEFALAAAQELAETGETGWVVASLATDGEDGPTGAAGAVADAGTVTRAQSAGVDPVRALERNDSLSVFEAAGGIVRPGPTGTNVNDLYLAVRLAAATGDR